MNKFAWCEHFAYLRGQRIAFTDREYLRAVYNSPRRRVVMRCSRQVEKTTFICNTVAHAAVMHPGVRIIVVFPRGEQASVFAHSRLTPMLETSPVIRRILLGRRPQKLKVMNMRFQNGSEVYIRSAYHSGDTVRGIDGDFLLVDELQDVAGGDLPVLEQALSHSPHRRVVLTGTPKMIDNHLEDAFSRSTANEWRVPCPCGELVFLDEQCLGPQGPLCPACQAAINPRAGHWVARNPSSDWGDGFSLNHLVTPWLNYGELLEAQRSYNPALFRNECLGLPTYLGDHIVTREQVEQCCTARPMANSLAEVPPAVRGQLVAGIDWGGGAASGTVLVIGYITRDDHFHVVHLFRCRAQEDPDAVLQSLTRRCEMFRVRVIAADGAGNGNVYNNLLLNMLPQTAGLYAIYYSSGDQAPRQYKGRLWHWTIGRSASLGMVFTRVRKQRIHFPRLGDVRCYLDEIWCEVAEYDDQQRSIKYTHPETQPDDTLHALNYAATLARYGLDRSHDYEVA